MDVKSKLRDAREAIKHKDFIKSSQICREILDKDEMNYLALVFLGLSIQETKPSEESEKLFRKAVEINPENLLAWNGLANYYEKSDSTEAKLELIKIYTYLIGKETTEKKLIEYCEKLCSLYKYTNVEEIFKVIYDKVENGNYSEAALSSSRSSLANVLKQSGDLSDDILEVYEDILSNLVAKKETATPDYYSQYLMVLNKRNKIESLIPNVVNMLSMFPDEIISMNWICKIYNELYVEKKTAVKTDFVNIEEIYGKLLKLEPTNEMGLFTQAIHKIENGEYSVAQELLNTVVKTRPGLVHVWILLTRVNIVLHCYHDASESAYLAIRLLKSPKCNCDKSVKSNVETLLLEALSRSSEVSDWEKVIEIYEKLNDDECRELGLPHYARANIKLGNTVEAKESLTNLERKTNSEKELSVILCAQLLRRERKYVEALSVLQKNKSESSEWYLELGIAFWEMNDYENCLCPFLKATKLDPNNFYCFFYLGRYYRDLKQYDKARRCYEKSYKLCTTFSEAALELSRIYIILKNWDSNTVLLKTIIKDKITKQNMWAWLQMGLTLMEQGDHEGAIDNFRLALRVDDENSNCWESLADAYLARGAYTSAQKAYEKVIEISGVALYPALQIATIKKETGYYFEAISDFEAILRLDKKCVLTLTGLAEACLSMANECHLFQRLGTARDYAQYAAESATSALKTRSEISCLWKIIADSCMLVAQLPDKYACLMMSRAMDVGGAVDGDKILERDDLLQLAARCYCRASNLTDDNHRILYDLALCYLTQAKNNEDETVAKELLTRAQAILQHCASIKPTYWQHWNLMGIVAMNSAPPNYALAQHAFIRAVTLDRNCAEAWTNLGVLYLTNDNISLANKAFGQAQRADPDYAQSWIGQALLAETLDEKEEAMDLFRHSISLNFHPQGALGYGDLLCRKLIEKPENANLDVVKKLHAVPAACDALTWYIEKEPYNCCAWNMLGLLKERLGLLASAADAFRKSINLSAGEYCDSARVNQGRVLVKLGRYKDAIKVCADVQESSFNSGIWYALAFHKDKQFQHASSIYLAIVENFAKDQFSIGDVVACIAIITYVLDEPELAKNTIIESFTQRLPTARVMYALIALGVLQKDNPLVSLTLKQVEVLDDVPKSIEDFTTLLSYVHIYQGNHAKAIRKTSTLIHLLPNKWGLWLTLALALLHSLNGAESMVDSAHAAFKAAQSALRLSKEENVGHKDVSKIYCTVSAGASLVKDNKLALIAAQKALHCTPNGMECWVMLNDSLEADTTSKFEVLEATSRVLRKSSEEYREIRTNCIF